ncbi:MULTISPECIES: hypothetical protein [Halomonas]|nr:hypothetical protein [Halomonas citrativorans]
MGAAETAKEVFSHLIKLALLLGGAAVLYVWLENKLLKKFKKKRRGRR